MLPIWSFSKLLKQCPIFKQTEIYPTNRLDNISRKKLVILPWINTGHSILTHNHLFSNPHASSTLNHVSSECSSFRDFRARFFRTVNLSLSLPYSLLIIPYSSCEIGLFTSYKPTVCYPFGHRRSVFFIFNFYYFMTIQ